MTEQGNQSAAGVPPQDNSRVEELLAELRLKDQILVNLNVKVWELEAVRRTDSEATRCMMDRTDELVQQQQHMEAENARLSQHVAELENILTLAVPDWRCRYSTAALPLASTTNSPPMHSEAPKVESAPAARVVAAPAARPSLPPLQPSEQQQQQQQVRSQDVAATCGKPMAVPTTAARTDLVFKTNVTATALCNDMPGDNVSQRQQQQPGGAITSELKKTAAPFVPLPKSRTSVGSLEGTAAAAAAGEQQDPGNNNQAQEVILIERKSVGHILGKNQKKIKEIRTRSGASVDVDYDSEPPLVILEGTKAQAKYARHLVEEWMEYLTTKGVNQPWVLTSNGPSRSPSLPTSVGINNTVLNTGHRIPLNPSGDASDTQPIEKLEWTERQLGSGVIQAVTTIKAKHISVLFGAGGRNIQPIRWEIGAKVHCEAGDGTDPEHPCKLIIKGNPDIVNKAKQAVWEVLCTGVYKWRRVADRADESSQRSWSPSVKTQKRNA